MRDSLDNEVDNVMHVEGHARRALSLPRVKCDDENWSIGDGL